ncbi:hypothetical protein [Terriglobus roseus]|uniref:hypothetical protein n=1 Tax=Terriglobus roseus TaxID=392734 RepID=UPI0002D50CF8|nr:hypothetical protein [Terriglobus roseus]
MILDQQQESKPANIGDSAVIGKPQSRVDGPLKTTGAAMYSSDHHFEGLVYAWPTTATVASGTISAIDTAAAAKMPGVLAHLHTREHRRALPHSSRLGHVHDPG